MSQILDSIRKGLALAAAKGCPVDSIWVSPGTYADIRTGSPWTRRDGIQEHHVSVVRMDEHYLIKLACGWTDRTGHERTDINALDVCMEHQHFPLVDTTTMETHPLWATF